MEKAPWRQQQAASERRENALNRAGQRAALRRKSIGLEAQLATAWRERDDIAKERTKDRSSAKEEIEAMQKALKILAKKRGEDQNSAKEEIESLREEIKFIRQHSDTRPTKEVTSLKRQLASMAKERAEEQSSAKEEIESMKKASKILANKRGEELNSAKEEIESLKKASKILANKMGEELNSAKEENESLKEIILQSSGNEPTKEEVELLKARLQESATALAAALKDKFQFALQNAQTRTRLEATHRLIMDDMRRRVGQGPTAAASSGPSASTP